MNWLIFAFFFISLSFPFIPGGTYTVYFRLSHMNVLSSKYANPTQ